MKRPIWTRAARRVLRTVVRLGDVSVIPAEAVEALFDAAYYCATYSDVPKEAAGAFEHFRKSGWAEGRRPNALFDFGLYRKLHADVGDTDPLAHYILFGAPEGRSVHPLFDPAHYVRQAPEGSGRALAHFLAVGGPLGLDPHPLFDSKRYRYAYRVAGVPIFDYLAGGWRNGRKPHALFDPAFYLRTYPDVAKSGAEPLAHYVGHGERELRDPSEYFDVSFYYTKYADVRDSGSSALGHYLSLGYREYRDPRLTFNTAFYVAEHLGGRADVNPLVHYAEEGHAAGLATNVFAKFEHFLPAAPRTPRAEPRAEFGVDVIVPIYGGANETQRCVESVLAAGLPPYARLVLIDDCSPDSAIASYVASFSETPGVVALRNERNLGFVATVNRGMQLDVTRDVVLLNSDTEVANDWLDRLVLCAYEAPDIATVTPFTNNGTIASFPSMTGDNPLPKHTSVGDVDRLFALTNAGRAIDLPTAIGFAMYVRRDALDLVGYFDDETYGKGYGEENDFCLRAIERGLRNVLAADVFVYHEGGVSFSASATQRKENAMAVLRSLYPAYERSVALHVRRDQAFPYRVAVALTALRESGLPTLLFITHNLGGGIAQHVRELMLELDGAANILQLSAAPLGAVKLETLLAPFAFDIDFDPLGQYDALLNVVRAAGVGRVHVHHLINLPLDAERLVADLDVPFDFTVHDYYAICPQINLVDLTGTYCGEPDERACNACIAIRPNRAHLDIASWRGKYSWLLLGAERVITPTEDAAERMRRYYPDARLEAVFHPDLSYVH